MMAGEIDNRGVRSGDDWNVLSPGYVGRCFADIGG